MLSRSDLRLSRLLNWSLALFVWSRGRSISRSLGRFVAWLVGHSDALAFTRLLVRSAVRRSLALSVPRALVAQMVGRPFARARGASQARLLSRTVARRLDRAAAKIIALQK